MQTDRRPLAMLLLLAACFIGPTAKRYAPAQGPAGAAVVLALGENRSLGGELLAVEDTTLLLVENRQLIRVNIAAVRSLRGPRISARSLSEDTRQQLRLISRYPQGVSPELEERLLQAYGATAVRRLP